MPQIGYSQDGYLPKYIREDAKAFRKLTSYAPTNGWLEFRQDTVAVDPDTFFDKFGTTIGIGPDYQMRLLKDETDPRQTRHRRYQLYYKNIIVEGVEYTLHDKDKRLQTAHGRIVENLNLSVVNPILQAVALGIALADQKLTIADFIGTDKLPLGELVIARQQDAPLSQNYRLSYAFDIDKAGLKDPVRVYVNALTGEVFRRIPLHINCFRTSAALQGLSTESDKISELVPLPETNSAPLTVSTFVPLYNRYLSGQSTLTFETEQTNETDPAKKFRLSHQNGALVTRRDINHNGTWANNSDVFNGSTNWGTNLQNATTAHWLTQRVYSFYQQFAPDQNGIDRQGTYPHIVADYSLPGDEVNAYWSRNDLRIVFGFAPIGPSNKNPNFSRAFLAADILGHEYTHAITRYNADLNYNSESGAINESISDIFGTAFERYLFPNGWNWDVGEDSYQVRDMANPSRAFPPLQTAQPQIYLGPNWVSTTGSCDPYNDYCGVHTNSGVMNKWFHTLYTGIGPNGQSITPITFDNATQIVYWALRYGYLQSTSNYPDARDATRSAAGALFSNCSPQQRQVAAAWRTAGLAGPDCPDECNFTTADLSVTGSTCNQPLTFTTGCNGVTPTSCANVGYLWSGFGYLGRNIPNTSTITVTAPSSGGNYTFDVGAQKSGCWVTYKSVNVTINCATTTACNPVTSGNCYALKVQKTGLTLQVMGDGTIQQQNANNQSNQIWKLDDVGGSTFRFTTQDGTNRVITSNSGNAGEWLSLSGYNGAGGQKWYLQCNNTDNHYRVYRDNAVTWDVKDYGASPQLQLYGTTSDSFFDYRSFEFQSTTCPNSPPPPSGNLTIIAPAYNCQTGALTIQTSGGNGAAIEFQIAGLRGWDTNPNFTVPSYQLNGTTFTLQARQSGVEASGYQFTTTCSTPPPTGGLTIVAPSLNCSSGALTFNTSGGDGTTIEYRCAGLTDWTTTNVFTIPTYQRNGTSFTIQARQSGTEANAYVYTTGCAGYRLAAVEEKPEETFLVLPNPTTGRVTVRFWLAAGQGAVLQTSSTTGVEINRRSVVGTGQQQEESINLDREPAGVYLLTLQSGGKRLTGKVVLQR